MLLKVVLCSLLFINVHGYPSGAPTDACALMQPQHGVDAQSKGSNPYKLSLTQASSGNTLQVALTSNSNATPYKGFFLIAANRLDATIRKGTFQSAGASADWQNGPCKETGKDSFASVTHNSPSDKLNHNLTWTASASQDGEFCIRGAVVKDKTQWWKFDGSDSSHCFQISNGKISLDGPGSGAAIQVAGLLPLMVSTIVYMLA